MKRSRIIRNLLIIDITKYKRYCSLVLKNNLVSYKGILPLYL